MEKGRAQRSCARRVDIFALLIRSDHVEHPAFLYGYFLGQDLNNKIESGLLPEDDAIPCDNLAEKAKAIQPLVGVARASAELPARQQDEFYEGLEFGLGEGSNLAEKADSVQENVGGYSY
jgi:hypothetical protein